MYYKKSIILFCLVSLPITAVPASVSSSPYFHFTKQDVPPSFASNPASYPTTMINKGQNVYAAIEHNDTAQLTKNIDTYMQSIIGLMFYFYSKAVEKNQGFSNGAFVIKDPGFKVFNFLYRFVEKKWKPKDMF